MNAIERLFDPTDHTLPDLFFKDPVEIIHEGFCLAKHDSIKDGLYSKDPLRLVVEYYSVGKDPRSCEDRPDKTIHWRPLIHDALYRYKGVGEIAIRTFRNKTGSQAANMFEGWFIRYVRDPIDITLWKLVLLTSFVLELRDSWYMPAVITACVTRHINKSHVFADIMFQHPDFAYLISIRGAWFLHGACVCATVQAVEYLLTRFPYIVNSAQDAEQVLLFTVGADRKCATSRLKIFKTLMKSRVLQLVAESKDESCRKRIEIELRRWAESKGRYARVFLAALSDRFLCTELAKLSRDPKHRRLDE